MSKEYDQKVIASGYEARKKILNGIKKASDIVCSSLGPAGKNTIYESEYNKRVDISDTDYDSQAPTCTNDGVRIMSKIVLDDPLEDLGAQLLFEASYQTNDEVGDGTTTVTLLCSKIVEQVMRDLNETGEADLQTLNTMEIKKQLSEAKDKVIESLKKKSKEIKSQAELEQIAITSVEDEALGKKIAEAWWKIGKDGWVGVEGHKGKGIEIEIHEGMRQKAKLISEYMMTTSKREMIVKDACILVTNQNIEDFSQIKDLVIAVANEAKFNLIILAPKFETKAIQQFNTARIQAAKFNEENKGKGKSAVKIFGVKIPSLTEKKGGQAEDIAIFTGGKFIDYNQLMDLNSVSFKDLGFAEKVYCDNEDIIIGGGAGKVNDRIKELKEEMEAETDTLFKKKLENRIASLNSGIGTIKVGSTTSTERRYSKLKMDDAVGACKAALQEGYVKGAGQTLKTIKTGNQYLDKALEAPYAQIQKNAGGSLEIPDWVIDPTKVERVALERAVSIASMIISTDNLIAYKRTDDSQINKVIDAINNLKNPGRNPVV